MVAKAFALPFPTRHAPADRAADGIGCEGVYRSGVRRCTLRHVRKHTAPAITFPAFGTDSRRPLSEKKHMQYPFQKGHGKTCVALHDFIRWNLTATLQEQSCRNNTSDHDQWTVICKWRRIAHNAACSMPGQGHGFQYFPKNNDCQYKACCE